MATLWEEGTGAQGPIGYITDLEGDLALWHRFIEISHVLKRSADGFLELLDGAYFVYGGDVVDHGPGDLEILEDLVTLKRRYTDRVHLIVGNRDMNKLRLPVELSSTFREAWPLAKHPGVYWLGDAQSPAKVLSEQELAQDSLVTHLKWILRDTMGAPNAFECRRRELGRRAEGISIDDETVAASFVTYSRPGGILFEYLSLAELAVVVGDVLFVHAGLPRCSDVWCPGWVPGSVPREGVPLRLWVQALDEFKSAGIQQVGAADGGAPTLEAWSTKGGYDHTQPGSALLQYMMRDMPDGTRQPSIIYNGCLDEEYQPMKFDEATLAWLRDGGVRRVVSGHLPNGDAPLILRMCRGVDVITADISYAKNVSWTQEGEVFQGSSEGSRAVCEVVLECDSGKGAAHGFLSNGMAFEARLEDVVVGRITHDGWRVKGRTHGLLVLSKNAKWAFESRLAKEEEVQLL